MKRENMFFHLFGVFRSTREFFTYTETSPLPVKGCLFWPMLGTHRHWTVKVILPATPTVTRDIRLLWSLCWGPVTLTPIAKRLAVELSLHVPSFFDLGLSRRGLGHPTVRLCGECFIQLCHRRGYTCEHIYTTFIAIKPFRSGDPYIQDKKG